MKKIDSKYQCIPFWSWNEKMDIKPTLDQIKWMKSQGIGGFFMHARSGLLTKYLSKDWFKAINASKTLGAKLKMQPYAYDENGWPSGFVGGKLLKESENLDSFLTYKYGPYDKKACASFDYSKDKLIRVNKGKNCFNIYINLSNSTVDICNPKVVKKFINLTHEKYFKEDKNHELKGFFTDEPQLYRWGQCYSRMLPEYFKKKYKEDIFDRIGLIFLDKEGYRDFRYKYYKALQDLMLHSFAKQIYDWCTYHDYKLTGHYVEESGLRLQLGCCGGIMPFYEYEHIPGCDWLTRNIRDNSLTGKQLGSVAAQLGKKQVLCEMFAGCGWDVTPLELKHIAEYLYVDGVNLMCQHLLPFSERGNRKRDWPGHFSSVNPWIKKDFKSFNDYFTNLGYLLANSTSNVKVCMLHPIRSCYLEYKFDRQDNQEAFNKIESSLFEALNLLDDNHIPFHLVDETLLAKYGSVKGKKFICGKCSYDYLVLPLIYTMDKETEKLIHQFINNGGKVLLLSNAPQYLEGNEYNYDYLKSNCTLNDLKKSYPIECENFHDIRITLKFDSKKNPYLYVINLGEEIDYKIIYKGFKNYLSINENRVISNNLHFNKYESKILYPTNKNLIKEKKLEPLILNKNYSIKGNVNNYLTIDNVSYSFDNKKYSKSFYHIGVFNELLKQRIDKDIYLKYEFNVTKLTKKYIALIEDMNTKEVYINNQKIIKDGVDEFLDTYDISKYVKLGKNKIIVKIHFYQDKNVYDVLFGNVNESLKNCLVYNTNIEAIFIKGDFSVNGEFIDGKTSNVIIGNNFSLDNQNKKIKSLIKDGFPFFHGNIHLTQEINVKDINKELIFNDRFQLIDVYINDKFVDRLMFNYKLDISKHLKKGKNKIDLILTVGNRNTLGVFHHEIEEPLITAPEFFELNSSWNKDKNPYFKERFSFVKTII